MKQIKIEQLLPLLKSGWVAMDKDGTWYWHNIKPYLDDTEYWRDEVCGLYCFNIAPFDGDWKDSLIKVEHKEEE